MALNTLEYAKIFQTALDKQIRESATTGWMEANAGQVVYNFFGGAWRCWPFSVNRGP